MAASPSQALGTSQLPSPLAGHKPQYFITTGEAFIGITCMLLVLCTAAVVGRLVARRMTKAMFEADDYASLLALSRITSSKCKAPALQTCPLSAESGM
ncbi:MAG: hypothetical protein Q9205_005922 [Flavoplaca limonia]